MNYSIPNYDQEIEKVAHPENFLLEEEATEMFGEGGKEEVKEHFTEVTCNKCGKVGTEENIDNHDCAYAYGE